MMWTRRDDALAGVREGARLVAGNACGTPLTLLRALANHAERVDGLRLYAGILLGELPIEDAVRSGRLRLTAWHVYGPVRQLSREGLVDYLPVRLSDLPDTVLSRVDVALIRVGAPDANGLCSLGPSTTFAAAAAELAPLVVAEVSDEMPWTGGDSTIHVSRIDRFVRAETPAPEYIVAPVDETSRVVAEHVARIIPEGATVQLGIGSVSEALASVLAERESGLSLGLTGLVTDAMIPFVEALLAEGRGPVEAIELMGGPGLMAFADANPSIRMRSSKDLHNPVVLSRTPRLVSVHSAVAVDLRGQVVAESVRGNIIAGVGGSADFAEGAHLSPGGMCIIALKSMTRRGESTIVPFHDPADVVTAAHHSVDAVVTEHGAALLRGRTRRERAAGLVAVAAPEYRDTLWAELEAVS